MSKPRGGKGSGQPRGRGGKGRGTPGKGGARPTPTRRNPDLKSMPPKRTRGRTGPVGARKSADGLGGDQVEGLHAVRELIVAGRRRVHEVVVATERSEDPALDDILTLARQLNVPVRELGRAKLDAIARTAAHQGVVAQAAALRETGFEDLVTASDPVPFLLACDGITDPGNLGALLRTACAAGVTGVVLPRHRAAHVTPAVTKAAAGAIEHLRFSIVGGLPAAMARAAEAGVVSIGLDMEGDTSIHALPPLDQPAMIVLGAEGRGLGRLVRERCEVVASIPMTGPLESLNVSVAGALAMYEVVRQRSA